MSVEVISIIIAAVGLFITLGGGMFAALAWLIRRMDEGFGAVNAQLDKRFEKVDERLSDIQAELNDVKVSVARLEGSRERLILPR